jgi:sugar/nucleoside kinase (ribokinase family)
MTALYDVAAIGNAIVDVIAQCDDAFLEREGLVKGSMALIDPARAASLYDVMAAGIEASGGSAANTAAGVASFGGKVAFIGKVADDQLGAVFRHDMKAIGCDFTTPSLAEGPATAQSLINVTADAQRTMSTYLGACVELNPADVDPAIIEAAQFSYLEGYLFDPPEARRAFAKAAALSHGAGRKISMTLSDSFMVDRHRGALLGFIETQCDIVFANADEVCSLFETTDFDAAVKALASRCRDRRHHPQRKGLGRGLGRAACTKSRPIRWKKSWTRPARATNTPLVSSTACPRAARCRSAASWAPWPPPR